MIKELKIAEGMTPIKFSPAKPSCHLQGRRWVQTLRMQFDGPFTRIVTSWAAEPALATAWWVPFWPKRDGKDSKVAVINQFILSSSGTWSIWTCIRPLLTPTRIFCLENVVIRIRINYIYPCMQWLQWQVPSLSSLATAVVTGHTDTSPGPCRGRGGPVLVFINNIADIIQTIFRTAAGDTWHTPLISQDSLVRAGRECTQQCWDLAAGPL